MILNPRGDERKPAGIFGAGCDISSQRIDELDEMAVDFCKARVDEGRTVYAMDAACGLGGASVAMARQGAAVHSFDACDNSNPIRKSVEAAGSVSGSVSFRVGRMETAGAMWPGVSFDAIVCQRAVHYLPHPLAVDFLLQCKGMLAPGGSIFISASGLSSELSDGYCAKGAEIGRRMSRLSPLMAQRHAIHAPVCLYSKDELEGSLRAAGFVVCKSWVSDFGNIKCAGVLP